MATKNVSANSKPKSQPSKAKNSVGKKNGEDHTTNETKKKVLDAVANQQAWERGDGVATEADESEKTNG